MAYKYHYCITITIQENGDQASAKIVRPDDSCDFPYRSYDIPGERWTERIAPDLDWKRRGLLGWKVYSIGQTVAVRHRGTQGYSTVKRFMRSSAAYGHRKTEASGGLAEDAGGLLTEYA